MMKRRTRYVLVLLLVGLGGMSIILAMTSLTQRLDNIATNPNGLIRHFAPTWRSIKRITDLPYLLIYTLRGSDLPIYEITLTKKDKANLLDNLPDFPEKSGLYEEYKKTVKGELRVGDYYTNDAKIRYRGVSANHWNAVKKSWQINLPNEKPFGARTDIRLFLPEDKGWIIAALNAHRARKLGLITPEILYARLYVNQVDMGVYLLIEGWEESMLEHNGRVLAPLYSNKNLDIHAIDLLKPESLDIWENRFEKQAPHDLENELDYFLTVIAQTTDEEFEQQLPLIVNMNVLYRWILVSTLSGSMHQGNVANQNWYFNMTMGKLEPIVFDVALQKIEGPIDLQGNRLVNRVLKNKKFRAEFMEILRMYIRDEATRTDDIAFYDETARTLRPEILNDTKKVQSSYEVLDRIRKERSNIIHNMEKLAALADSDGEGIFAFSQESYPLTHHATRNNDFATTLNKVRLSPAAFVRENPQFTLHNQTTIVLSRGTHIITKDIIVPHNAMLVIEPGTTILFNPGTSLISYSRVEALGTRETPIRFTWHYQDAPWGVFGVVGAPGKNVFRFTTVEYGSDATMNGIYFSGSLSVHGTNLEFTDGRVSDSLADDGIHVLRGEAYIARSVFSKTSSDGIDIDLAQGTGSVFENNIFRNSGGDAMDLSFSEMTLRNNTVLDCKDKGISVGEASKPHIEGNVIAGCVYGIAVKDNSTASIAGALLIHNQTGIGLYRKKPHFIRGGHASVSKSIIWKNEHDIALDEFSDISVQESTLTTSFPGTDNMVTAPDFKTLLPPELYRALELSKHL